VTLDDVGTVDPSSDRDGSTDFTSSLRLSAVEIQESERLFAEWEDGPFAHLKRLEIPQPDVLRGFAFSANGHLFDGLLSVNVYCDSLTGVSGSGQDHDPIVADMVTSGSLRFAGKGGERIVTPGQVCIRDTKASWQFSCSPGTRIRVVSIPRQFLIPRIGSPRALERAFVADAQTPEVRFLANFLEAVEKSSVDLGRSARVQNLAVDACAALFSGMLSGRSEMTPASHSRTLAETAKNIIEKNLDRHDLSPAAVARIMGVSIRSLHRSFAESNDSVMAFARRRRLERAREELISSGNAATVSQLAARWQFSDASHFIRHFKSSYGSTPAVYVRNYGKADQ
jgi:AraC-like DNA-binding protein